jgi:hypothetical protein
VELERLKTILAKHISEILSNPKHISERPWKINVGKREG